MKPNSFKFKAGFTLVELLVATAILAVMVIMILNITSVASSGIKYSTAKVEAFSNARSAFDIMTRALSTATLNTYYDYYDATATNRQRRDPTNGGSFVPATYGRYSELEFTAGKALVTSPRAQVTHSLFFQAPRDYTETNSYRQLGGLLNAMGFYLEFHNDSGERPAMLPAAAPRYRYRLMQYIQPTENFSVYSSIPISNHNWFTTAISGSNAPVRLLAENIIALVITPRLPEDATAASSLTTTYEYDSVIGAATPPITWPVGVSQPISMNQMPPTVRVLLIALDENSMRRFQGTSSTQPNFGFSYASVFQTVANVDADLKTVTDALTANNLNYRVFQTDVAIRGAKWTP